ncbi:hypothetical protein [Chitinophaga sp. Cy-1792]|uniref:hypothetical protein n=1 Tax=Chitinophaga sp. Cy-1792 TaxID=2608339 RepID=UPI001423C96C|nr:hypothetical protein [Chitinophaga sp. Cy-1792]NIG56466.1 hypothetical protein [Chitinophaga sp. Cy-1792]
MSKKATTSDAGPVTVPGSLVPEGAIDSVDAAENSGLTPDYLFYKQQFYAYPVQLNAVNLRKIGLWGAICWLFSWLRVSVFPHKKPSQLESALKYSVGSYGFNKLYKDYAKKILDRPAREIALSALPENRQLVTVSVLLKKLSLLNKKTGEWKPLNLIDCNIALAQADIKAADLEIRNDTATGNVWVALHYYSNPPENGWHEPDEAFQQQAVAELEKTGLAAGANVLDIIVERQEIIVADHFNFAKSQLADKNYEDASLAAFIFQNPANRWFVIIAVASIIIQFCVFKYFYPFAAYIHGDSFSYLNSAYHNFDISTYPIGYPRFLRLFSIFCKWDTALVAFQYLCLESSLLALVFTLFYFLKPARGTKIVLICFVLFNPVLNYLSNYVSSDTMFLSLSLTWFTLLFWIMYKPTGKLVFWHAIVLAAAFTVRYNALFYPAIALLGFFLARKRFRLKMAGLGLAVLLIGLFIQFNESKYYELTKIRQFTPFSGWQMANNAMYTYRYIDSAHRKPVPARFKTLDSMITTYFDSTRDVRKFPAEALVASTVYMWSPGTPLHVYMNNQFKKDSTAGDLKRWASMGPLFKDYGSFIIRTYPMAFAEHYIWPNFLKYYTPPVEFLEKYNMGIDSVQEIAKVWFNYKDRKVKVRLKTYDAKVLDIYPTLVGVMSVLFLFGCIFMLVLGAHKEVVLRKALLLAFALWSVNLAFSLFASPIALRFQLFPILVSGAFTILVLGYIVGAAFTNPQNANK